MGKTITENIDIDFCEKKSVIVNAKQYDKMSRYILVSCFNGDESIKFNNDTECAFIRYLKADSVGVFNSCEIQNDGNILIELTEQMLSTIGMCMADVVIVNKGTEAKLNSEGKLEINSNSILSTMNFCINVYDTPIDNCDIESSYEYNALNDLLTKVTANYEIVISASKGYADYSKTYSENAKTSEDNSEHNAKLSESYAIGGTELRTDENYDNAKYYYQQSKSISESFSGALRPMGTIVFANLPSIDRTAIGDMYNISDEFVTTSDFKEGKGYTMPIGTNVYLTTDKKWDCLAGTTVVGVKGENETTYRKGNVNITADNIGLGSVVNDLDYINDNVGVVNLIPYPYLNVTKTSNGITFTDNGDGTVTVEKGTCTGDVAFYFNSRVSTVNEMILNGTYTVSGCPSSGSGQTYYISVSKGTTSASVKTYGGDFGSGLTFNADVDASKGERMQISITIKKDTVITTPLVFKPMLERGNDAHPYKPYIGTDNLVDAIVDTNNNIDVINDNTGVVNLIPYPYYHQRKLVINGVTFVEENGIVTANGTATASASYQIQSRVANTGKLILKTGTYVLSGCPSGGSSSTYRINTNGADATDSTNDFGEGSIWNITKEQNYGVFITIASGYTCNNLVFKPMLERGTISHEYTPYIGDSLYSSISNNVDNITDIANDTLLNMAYMQSLVRGTSVSHSDNESWTFTANTANTIDYVRFVDSTMEHFKIGETYTFSAVVETGTNYNCVYAGFQKSDNTVIGSYMASGQSDGRIYVTFTVPEGCSIVTLYAGKSACVVGDTIKVSQFMCTKGSNLVDYRPYNGFDNVVDVVTNVNAINDNVGIVNLLLYPYAETTITRYGVTFTDVGDGTIKVSGTATADATLNVFVRINTSKEITDLNGTYTMSGCPSGGSSSTYFMSIAKGTTTAYQQLYGYDYGTGITTNLNVDSASGERLQIQITVKSGKTVSNLVFKPMLERGTVAHTYKPYIGANNVVDAIMGATANIATNTANIATNKTNIATNTANIATNKTNIANANEEITEISDYIGNPNLIPYPHIYMHTPSIYGITFKNNGDGTFTANGTATTNVELELNFDMDLKGTYTLSGCPKNGSSSSYYVSIDLIKNSSTENFVDYGDGITKDLDIDHFNMRLTIVSGITVSNLTFKPMLQKGSVKNDYKPYIGADNLVDAIIKIMNSINS